jgi:exodeoxyribonuclease VII small subunit
LRAGEAAARKTLELAASLDPDTVVRWTAARALARAAAADGTAPGPEVAWIHLAPAPDAAPVQDETAEVALAGGLAVPVAFDDDGYALIPGVGPGEARVRLAPRLPAYSACRTMTERTTLPETVAPTEAPPFEVAIRRLTEIVQTLERGDLPLEESLRLFEEGVKLSRVSQGRLDAAEKRVEQLLAVDDRGQARTAPFATDAADARDP